MRCPDRSEAANVETATCALTPGMILSEAISSRFNPVDALFFCHQIFFTLGKDPQVRIVFLLSCAGFSDILCYFLIELTVSICECKAGLGIIRITASIQTFDNNEIRSMYIYRHDEITTW